MPRLISLCLVLAMAACGTRGALTLPPGPPTQPLLGNPKPAAKPSQPTASPAENNSTDPKVTAQ